MVTCTTSQCKLRSFRARKFRNGERNLHCDIVHITTKWVSSLTLDCNGVFAIKDHCVTRYHFAPESSPLTNSVWKLILACGPGGVIFSGVSIRLGTILGRFSIIYFRGLGLRIRVRVWVGVRVWVRVGVRVRVSVVL